MLVGNKARSAYVRKILVKIGNAGDLFMLTINAISRKSAACLWLIMMLLVLPFTASVSEYQRNKAVPVEKVLFGQVLSVRNISEQELIQDQANGWQVFGGALIGGAIGNQFGGGSGKVAATILGALLGANISEQRHSQQKVRVHQLVELMIKIDNGDEYMVIQDYDPKMLFQPQDKVRMIYLANDTVRIDLQQ